MSTEKISNAQQQKQFRQNMKDQGMKKIYAYLTAEEKQRLLDFAKERDLDIGRAIMDAIDDAREFRRQAYLQFSQVMLSQSENS